MFDEIVERELHPLFDIRVQVFVPDHSSQLVSDLVASCCGVNGWDYTRYMISAHELLDAVAVTKDESAITRRENEYLQEIRHKLERMLGTTEDLREMANRIPGLALHMGAREIEEAISKRLAITDDILRRRANFPPAIQKPFESVGALALAAHIILGSLLPRVEARVLCQNIHGWMYDHNTALQLPDYSANVTDYRMIVRKRKSAFMAHLKQLDRAPSGEFASQQQLMAFWQALHRSIDSDHASPLLTAYRTISDRKANG